MDESFVFAEEGENEGNRLRGSSVKIKVAVQWELCKGVLGEGIVRGTEYF